MYRKSRTVIYMSISQPVVYIFALGHITQALAEMSNFWEATYAQNSLIMATVT